MAPKGKLDNSKQDKASTYLDGWVNTAKRLRSVAIVILIAVIAFTIFLSFVTPYKYFPKQPTNDQIAQARLRYAIQHFHKPPR